MDIEQKNGYQGDDALVQQQSLAYHLKHALVQINNYNQAGASEQASSIAQHALTYIDGYLLSSQPDSQLQLMFEPVALGGLLQDVMHQLTPLAQQHNCRLQLQGHSRSKLASVDKRMVRAVFYSLGCELMTAAASESGKQPAEVIFALRDQPQTVQAGVYAANIKVSARSMHALRKLVGQAPRPCPTIPNSAGGIILADSLLQRMGSRLSASRFQRQPGLAAHFPQNQQLQIV